MAESKQIRLSHFISAGYQDPKQAHKTWQNYESFLGKQGRGIFRRVKGVIRSCNSPLELNIRLDSFIAGHGNDPSITANALRAEDFVRYGNESQRAFSVWADYGFNSSQGEKYLEALEILRRSRSPQELDMSLARISGESQSLHFAGGRGRVGPQDMNVGIYPYARRAREEGSNPVYQEGL